jgi:hypothetical protein
MSSLLTISTTTNSKIIAHNLNAQTSVSISDNSNLVKGNVSAVYFIKERKKPFLENVKKLTTNALS